MDLKVETLILYPKYDVKLLIYLNQMKLFAYTLARARLMLSYVSEVSDFI